MNLECLRGKMAFNHRNLNSLLTSYKGWSQSVFHFVCLALSLFCYWTSLQFEGRVTMQIVLFFFVTALCTWLSYIIFSDAICQWWSCSFMPHNVLSRQKMKWDSLCWGREHSGKMYCSRWATGSFFHVGKIDDNTFYSRVCILQFSNCLLSWLKIH